ncbi:MAG TPA: HlyD family secretion protein [Polyangiales bacterium]|nr:HlyD family secretion protein [Polyangiales bacterium]
MTHGNLARKSLPPARGERGENSVVQAAPEAPAAAEPAEVAVAKPRRTRLIVLATLAIAVVTGIGSYYFLHRNIQSTDDAQIDAELVGVAARSGGTVSAVYFQDNQAVKQGQLLAEIDPAPARAKLAQADANLSAAQAAAHAADAQAELATRNAKADLAAASAGFRSSNLGAENSLAEIAQASASVESSRARLREAELNLTRVQQLFQNGAAAGAQRDQLQSARDVAATELARAEAALSSVTLSRDLARSRVAEAAAKLSQSDQVDALIRQALARAEQAHAAVATAAAAKSLAELELSYAEIYAPSDGVVSKKNLSVGQTIATGQSVVQLVPDARWVTANFKETQLDRMRVGQPVNVHIDAYPGREFEGRVESFSGATGARFALLPPDNATGNFTKVVQRVGVRVKVLNAPKELPLLPGMSAVVDVNTAAPGA